MKKKRSHFLPIFSLLIVFALILGSLDVFLFAKYKGRSGKQKAEIVDMTDPNGNTDYGKIYYSPIDVEHVVEYEEGSSFGYIDNEVLVVANDGVSREQIAELAAKYDAEIVGEIEVSGDYQLRLTTAPDELDPVVESIAAEPAVASAYPNYVAEISEEVGDLGDFYYGNQWKSDIWSSPHSSSWGFCTINTPAAWNLLDQNLDSVFPVKVGVCDGGFSPDHPDLGFVQFFYDNGENGVKPGKTSTEHGTHVSGTFAANTDDSTGICGVYPYGNGNLYAASAPGAYSKSDIDDFFTSVMCEKVTFGEMIIRNVKVINFSMGFNHKRNRFKRKDGSIDDAALTSFWNNPASHTEMMKQSSALGDFFNRMIEKNYDFVLVAAAGNDSTQYTSHPIAEYGSHLEARYSSPLCMIEQAEYPGVYDRIIVVGALEMNYDPVAGTSTIDIAGYSNGGVRTDIYAPGSSIFSTTTNGTANTYDYMSGTSMAAPHVSGVAAMVWSANYSLTGAEVKDIIVNNTASCDAGVPMLDAYASVHTALGLPHDIINLDGTYGSAFGFVVKKGLLYTEIEGAEVILTDTFYDDIDHSYFGTTGINGHFEVFAPEGEYKVMVKAEGYKDYISETPVTLKSNEITYMDKIKLKKGKRSRPSPKPSSTHESESKETPVAGKIYKGEDIKRFLPDKFGKFDIGIGLDKIRAWTYYEGHYYAIFDYAMSAKVMTLATKQDKNVHLVTITGEEEQKLIEELMLCGERDVYYTGGMVDADGDVFTVNGEDTDYSHWYEGCPENYGNEGKDDIIAIYRGAVEDPKSSPDYGYWFDLNEDEYNLFDFADFNVDGASRGIIIEWDTPVA